MAARRVGVRVLAGIASYLGFGLVVAIAVFLFLDTWSHGDPTTLSGWFTLVLNASLAFWPLVAAAGLRFQSALLLLSSSAAFVVVAFALASTIGPQNAFIGVPLILIALFLGLGSRDASTNEAVEGEKAP